MLQLKLNNLKYYAHHGWQDLEQKVGGEYVVNCVVDVTGISPHDKQLESTIDYESVEQLIKTEMSQSTRLIEVLVQRMADAILNKFEEVNSVELSVQKLNPPIRAELDSFEVVLIRERNT